MTFNRNLLSEAVRYGLAAGAVGLIGLTAAPAFAQEDDEEAARLERIEVTGSRIKRADVEGALPVTIIDRQQIDASGDNSVADFLRNTTFNSFGSVRPQSGSGAQANAGISLRGLGSGRTLVLIDGRRAPMAAATGTFQDINTIPLAAVERIEILSDGASAIYGSDAIGGVVNIITRKDFNGAEMTIGAGNPKREGGSTEEAAVIFGASSDRGSLLGGVSMNFRDIVFQRDRTWSSGGVSSFGNNFTRTPTGSFLNHPTLGSRAGDFACNSNGFFGTGTGSGSRCAYDFTFVAADEASIQNTSMFLRGQYQINDDWSTYLNGTVSRVESFGRYAPVPSSPWFGGSGVIIRPDSPNHPANRYPNDPYYQDFAGETIYLRHRFAALGNRDDTIENGVYDFNVGFQGRIGSVDLDFGARHTESKSIVLGRNYVVASLAQALVDSGEYDIYNPFGVPRSTLDGMIATVNRESTTTNRELYAVASFDLFEMGGGTASAAAGAEWRSEDWSDIYDSLSAAGSVSGSAGNSAFGSRNVRAAYFEALFPFLSNFEVTLAGRFDEYSDYGNDFAPKIGLRYQPLDNLTLRASYGEGFRAPTLDIVGQQPAFGADGVTDPATCLAQGQPAGCSTQVTSFTIANPNVESEVSQQYSLGFAWDATDWLNLTLDYYNIQVDNQLAFFATSDLTACLAGTTAFCPDGISALPGNLTPPQPGLGLGVARDPVSGEILYSQIGYSNLGTIETDGLDLNLRTNFALGDFGSLNSQFQIGYVNDYSINGGANETGLPGQPEFRANLSNMWTYGDFSLTWNISHIDSTVSSQQTLIDAYGPDYDYGYSLVVPSWTTHDIQGTWSAPWNGRLTLGINNVLDKDPALDPLDSAGRGFDFTLYDGYGRVPYIRYTQSF